jgi:hypothetical protein
MYGKHAESLVEQACDSWDRNTSTSSFSDVVPILNENDRPCRDPTCCGVSEATTHCERHTMADPVELLPNVFTVRS